MFCLIIFGDLGLIRLKVERFQSFERHLKSAGPSVAVEALLTPVAQSLGKQNI